MRFSFTDDQLMLADVVRNLLTKRFPAGELRATWDDGTGHSPQLWDSLGGVGVLGMLLPESAGGMNLTMADAVLVFEQLGYAAAPGPVLETIAVAAPALVGTSSSELASELAAGSTLATTAIDGGRYVAHVPAASVVLMPDGVLRDFDVEPVEGIDGGRRLARVSGGALTPINYDTTAAYDRGAVATAAYLLGVSQRMIDIATAYAREREQFGKPIGSFQAVKHLLADALLQLEFARPVVYSAAWYVAVDDVDVVRRVSMAKCRASDAAYQISRITMQVLGAIGYTWEADLHMWMKKAWALQRAYGDSTHHRRRVSAATLGSRYPDGASRIA